MYDRWEQQKFVAERTTPQNSEYYSSTAEIDSLLTTLQSVWADSVAPTVWSGNGNPPPAFDRFSADTYDLFYRAAKQQWARCHIWREYGIPALVQDYRQAKAERAVQYGPFFRLSGYWTLEHVNQCELDPQRWSELYEIQSNLPALIEDYVEMFRYRSVIEEQLQDTRDDVRQLNPVYGIRNAIYQGALAQAQDRLGQMLNKEVDPALLAPIARDLAYHYRGEGEKDSALAVLDAFAEFRGAANVSEDSLQAWYAAVSPEYVAHRLAILEEGQRDQPLLISTDEAPLAGEYVDLQTGKLVNLAELRGETVFIDFWTTWCGPCLVEIPELKSFAQKHRDRSDFTFLSVLADATAGGMDRTEAQEFVKERGLNYPVLMDRTERPLIQKFGVFGYPTKFLINKDGRIMRSAMEKANLNLELISTYLQERR